MRKYSALALTISFAIPLGLYLLLPATIWLVKFYPGIYGYWLFYIISWFSLALVADIIVSTALFLLLTEKPIHPAHVILLSLIMAGILWSLSLYPSLGASAGIWDLTMVGLFGLILGFSVLKVVLPKLKI